MKKSEPFNRQQLVYMNWLGWGMLVIVLALNTWEDNDFLGIELYDDRGFDESTPIGCDYYIQQTYSPLEAKEAQDKGLIDCKPSKFVQMLMDDES